jgi:Integrase core domain
MTPRRHHGDEIRASLITWTLAAQAPARCASAGSGCVITLAQLPAPLRPGCQANQPAHRVGQRTLRMFSAGITIVEYIAWFNGTRLHSGRGYLSPAEYEAAASKETTGKVA